MHGNVRENWDYDHAPGLAPHVRYGIQRDLTAECRCFIAAHLGDERVRRFVTRRRKQKRDIPDKSENEIFGRETRQVIRSFRLRSPSRLEVVTRLCKRVSSNRASGRKCVRFRASVVNSSHANQNQQKEEACQNQEG